MVKTWIKAGLGCVLMWAGARVVVPDDAAALEQEYAEKNRCDRAEIQELESEALALAMPQGCEDVSQCRSAPVGVKACGGPRSYVVYCAATTDEDRLLRALDKLARREERFNRQCGIISTCEFVSPPQLELVDGVCQAVTPAPVDIPQ